MEAIKDAAFTRRMRERLLPSTEVLVARLAEMSRERAEVQSRVEHYRATLEQMQARLQETQGASGPERDLAAELLRVAAPAPRARSRR